MASLSARPRLRPGIIVRRLTSRGESYVIVKDPDAQKYFKFEDWEHDLLVLFDGTRDLETIAKEFGAAHPAIGAGLQYVTDYLEGLRGLGLIERTERQRHLVMMDKAKTLRKRRLYSEQSTMLRIQFQLFDPDRTMDRIIPWIRWWWSPWFVLAWVTVFFVVLGFLLYHWDLYWNGLFALVSVTDKTLLQWIGLIAITFSTAIWHELGHGFTCKRFGGEVHNIGFMLFFFHPAFYCNIDDSYLFPRLSHRVYCTFGGAYFELMLCSVAAATWLWTPAEWWIHNVALTVVLLTGLGTVLFNANPLIKLDGYYVLMDWLDVPDLREESFQHIGSLIKKHVFRLEVPAKAVSRRRRRIYLVYGLLAAAYTATMLTLIFVLVRGWFVGWFGPAGYLVFFALVAYAMRRRLRLGAWFVHHLWLDKRELLRSGRRRAVLGAVLGVAALLLTVPRCPTRIEGAFTVEPGRRAVLRAPVDGLVREVRTTEGAAVGEGELLAVLESRDLVAEARLSEMGLARALREEADARAEDLPAARKSAAEARAAAQRLRVLTEKLATLTLRAPMTGVVTTPRVEEAMGRYLKQGDAFCTVDDLRNVRLVVTLSEREIEEVRKGVPLRVLPAAHPNSTLRSQVLSVAPVAQAPQDTGAVDLIRRTNEVRVQVEMENPEGLLRPGMTGRVQFLTRARSATGKLWWSFKRWAAWLVW